MRLKNRIGLCGANERSVLVLEVEQSSEDSLSETQMGLPIQTRQQVESANGKRRIHLESQTGVGMY